jgi:tRNA dimethylallyltransferase
MFQQGIVEETEAVLQAGYSPTLNSLNTVGYKECIALLQGSIDRDRAIQLTAQKTRNYAKRQITWFKNLPVYHLKPEDSSVMAKKVAQIFQERISK